jgi:hypothetical protein
MGWGVPGPRCELPVGRTWAAVSADSLCGKHWPRHPLAPRYPDEDNGRGGGNGSHLLCAVKLGFPARQPFGSHFGGLPDQFTTVQLYFFDGTGVWNSGVLTCKSGALPLEPHLQSILRWLFGRWGGGGLWSYLPGLALNLDPPDLSLTSS